jgi:hypothetical protein
VPSIIDMLDHPELFGPRFQDPSWMPWRAHLKSIFALPMSEKEFAAYQRHTGRTSPPAQPFAEVATIVGRRGGKSYMLAMIAIYLAFFRDYTPYTVPGEVPTIAIIAKNRRQARIIFRYIRKSIESVRRLKDEIVEASREHITLNNGVMIEISVASLSTIRGYTFIAVLCDEIATWFSDEEAANPDYEVIRAVRPGLMTIPGSLLLLASSPYGKKGELYNAFRENFGRDDAEVLVWKGSTLEMNPKIKPSFIDKALLRDPEGNRAEYLAEFRDDVIALITREMAEACVCWDRHELPPDPRLVYQAFVDPSGGSQDAMTCAIAHLEDAFCVLDCIVDVPAPFNPNVAVEAIVQQLRRYGITTVTGDFYAGRWPTARFREHGIEYLPSERDKTAIYRDFLPPLTTRRCQLLDNPRMFNQLIRLERSTGRAGNDRISHPRGGHDDTINAVAGALVGIDLDRRPPLITRADFVSPVPILVPEVLRWVAAVVCMSDEGEAAVVYFGQKYDRNGYDSTREIFLIDFDLKPLDRTLFAGIRERLGSLVAQTCAQNEMVWAPAELLSFAASEDVAAMELPEVDPQKGPLCAVRHVKMGQVTKCDLVREKEQTLPFGAVFDFKAGEVSLSPLREAAILAVIISLEEDASAYQARWASGGSSRPELY